MIRLDNLIKISLLGFSMISSPFASLGVVDTHHLWKSDHYYLGTKEQAAKIGHDNSLLGPPIVKVQFWGPNIAGGSSQYHFLI